MPAVITIDLAPTFDIGPLTVAWHGLTIAIGVLVGALLAGRTLKKRGLDPAPLQTMVILIVLGALVGGRLFYLAEHGELLEPGAWFQSNGFTFYGGFLAAAIGLFVYLRRTGHAVAYLDHIAVALPVGLAIGRVGDLINGEHYGAQTDFFLGVRNAHPEALTPRQDVAYHSGGLYEIVLALAVLAVMWACRRWLQRPTAATWALIALVAAGRFAEFFVRQDGDVVALGMSSAQWTSLILLVIAAAGAWWTLGPRSRHGRTSLQPTPG